MRRHRLTFDANPKSSPRARSAGAEVVLLWSRRSNRAAVVVEGQSATGEISEMECARGENPLDVYEHALAYLHTRAFPGGLERSATGPAPGGVVHRGPATIRPVAGPRRKLLTAFVAAAVALAFADSSVVVSRSRKVPGVRHLDRRRVLGDHVVQPRRRVVAFLLVPVLRRVDVGTVTRVGLAVFCRGVGGGGRVVDSPVLIAARCVQGLGAALLLAVVAARSPPR